MPAVDTAGMTRDPAGDRRRWEFRSRLPDAVPDDPDALVTYGTLLAQAHRLADQLVER